MVRSSIQRRKPWIIALCVLIALVMVLPLYDVFNVVGDMRKSGEAPMIQDPLDQLEILKEDAARLEDYIKDFDATPAVLKELVMLYMQINTYLPPEENDDSYIQRAIEVMKKALELDPEEMDNHLLLLDLYSQGGDFEKASEASYKVQKMLLNKLQEDPDDNKSRLYYSRLLGGYRYDYDSAIKHLNIILDSEPEESGIYASALRDKEMFSELSRENNVIEMEINEEDLKVDLETDGE